MRTLITETFIVIVIVVIVAAGLCFAWTSIGETIEDIRTALEERRIDRRIVAELRSASSDVLRSTLMDVVLWDAVALLDWLETKSMLTGDQKQSQVEECRRTIAERSDLYSTLVRDMEARELVKSIRVEIRNRDSLWKRKFLDRLEGRPPVLHANNQGSVNDGE